MSTALKAVVNTKTGVLECTAFLIAEGSRPIVAIVETPNSRLPVEDAETMVNLGRLLRKDRRSADWMSVDSGCDVEVHYSAITTEDECDTDRGVQIVRETEVVIDRVRFMVVTPRFWNTAQQTYDPRVIVGEFDASPDVVADLTDWLTDEIGRRL